jgi:hypothetical protein
VAGPGAMADLLALAQSSRSLRSAAVSSARRAAISNSFRSFIMVKRYCFRGGSRTPLFTVVMWEYCNNSGMGGLTTAAGLTRPLPMQGKPWCWRSQDGKRSNAEPIRESKAQALTPSAAARRRNIVARRRTDRSRLGPDRRQRRGGLGSFLAFSPMRGDEARREGSYDPQKVSALKCPHLWMGSLSASLRAWMGAMTSS